VLKKQFSYEFIKGALIDHVIHSHAAAADLIKKAQQNQTNIYSLLNQKVDELAKKYPLNLVYKLHSLTTTDTHCHHTHC
jgi:ribonucleotide monophosphatase NagD (HAD superfamily)